MAIRITIPGPYRKLTGGADTVEASAQSIPELFARLEERYPGIRPAFFKPDGTPQRFLNIYINDEDIRFLGGLKYTLQDGDEVLLIPAIAGGAGDSQG